MITVRNATDNDLIFCSELEIACFSEPWSKNAFFQSIAAEDTYFRVAENNGIPVGYYVAGNICDEVNLYTIAVTPDCRKQGIGKALLYDLINTAKNDNAVFVSLEVRESNENAKKLYESLQFECVGKRTSFYRKPTEDALLYMLKFKEEDII